MANKIELVISGTNLSVQALDQANRDVQRFASDVDRTMGSSLRSTQGFHQELSQAGRVTRLVAGDLAGTLNPALGNMVQSLGAAGSATRGMSGAMTGLVGSLAIIGVAGAQYISTLGAIIDKQAALNVAVRGFDAGSIRAQMAAAALEIEKSSLRMQAFRNMMQGPSVGRTFLDDLTRLFQGGLGAAWEKAKSDLTDIGKALGIVSRGTEDLAAARTALERVAPVERELQRAEAYQKQQAALVPLLGVEAQRASIAKSEEDFVAVHQRMTDALAAEATAAREAALAQGLLNESAAEARGEPTAFIREQTQALIQLIETTHLAKQRAVELQRDQGVLDIRSRRLPAINPEILPAEGVAPTAGELQQLGEISVRITQRRLEGEAQITQAERERLDILGQVTGLSLKERENLDALIGAERERLQIIEAQQDVKRLQADPATSPEAIEAAQLRVRNAELASQTGPQARQRTQLERTDFSAGVAKGFRDLNDEIESTGRLGERTVRDMATSMERTFSDVLFSPLEKGWNKALVDIPKQLALSTVRTLTDAFGRLAVGGVIQGAGRLFPSVAGGVGGVGGALTLVGGGAGVAGATPGVAGVTGGLQTLAGLKVLGTQAAPSPDIVSLLQNLPIDQALTLLRAGSSSLTAGASAIASAQALAGTASAGLIPTTAGLMTASELAALGSTAPEVVGPSVSAVGPSTLGQILSFAAPAFGVVAGVAGLGFTIAGALQGPPTAQNIAISGVSGAVSAAGATASAITLLAALGISLAPTTAGISIAVAAIVGAALGAGAGAAGKGDTGAGAKRTANRATIGNKTYNEIAAALSKGDSPQVTAGAPIHEGKNTVGGLLFRIAQYNASGFVAGQPWLWPPSSESDRVIAYMSGINVSPEEFSEGGRGTGSPGQVGTVGELIAAFGEGNPTLGGQRAQDLLEGFMEIVDKEVEDAENMAERVKLASQQTPFSFTDTLRFGGVGGVTARTFLPISRVGEIGTTRDLIISQDTINSLDPYVAEQLLRLLVTVDRDHQVGAFDRRTFSGEP